jgi:hypothetical protein
MNTPYIGFGNDTLNKLPEVKIGDSFQCPDCNQIHWLRGDDNGGNILLFYRCGEGIRLGAVNGRFIVYTQPDVSGEM